jgi:hypothetical protein
MGDNSRDGTVRAGPDPPHADRDHENVCFHAIAIRKQEAQVGTAFSGVLVPGATSERRTDDAADQENTIVAGHPAGMTGIIGHPVVMMAREDLRAAMTGDNETALQQRVSRPP